MSAFEIRRAGADDLPVVFRLVGALLKELGEEGEEAGALDVGALSDLQRQLGDRHIGVSLISAAVSHGQQRGWRRIDVTAPEAERWRGVRHFYEQNGFTCAGPKLKRLL